MKSECNVDSEGTKYWWFKDRFHRVDGPAIEYANGDKSWYINGKYHRTDGPAVEYADGTKYWYLNGEELTFKQWLSAVWDTLSKEEQKYYAFNGFEYEE